MSRQRQELPDATVSESDGVRYLHLGTPWVQGAMRVREPRSIELEYVQRMMAWMLWRPEAELAQGHAVQLGLGAAAITRFTHQAMRMRTTAVELNAQVIAACRQWFRLPADDARLAVVEADAGRWIAQAAPQSVNVLCVDLYDHDAAAPVLDDAGFYAACHAALADGGVMSVNLFGRDASFARSAARIAQSFGLDQMWSLRATREGNTVVIATRSVDVPDRDAMLGRAANIERRYGLPGRKWIKLVRPIDPALLNGPA